MVHIYVKDVNTVNSLPVNEDQYNIFCDALKMYFEKMLILRNQKYNLGHSHISFFIIRGEE